MNELTSKELQVALVIKEGRGFSSIQHPMYIEASLDGHYLDTNLVGPSSEPQFAEELTWMIDKKRLKRLRTSTGHIRVNCYSIVSPHERGNVGFLMLSLKSAQIQSERCPQVTEAWYKLLGNKAARPEVLLSYSIRSATLLPQISPFITAPTEVGVLRCGGDSLYIAPQLTQQGIIQIGPASVGTDVFLLTVVVGEATDLHLLVSENLNTQNDGKKSFHFCYTVCGHTINTAHFSVDPNCRTIIPDNRKIVIRIRSSLSVLRTYFDSQSVVPFLMMSDKEEVASTSVNLKTLIPTDSLEEFCSIYACDNDGLVQKSECYLSSAKTQQVPVGNDGSKPSVNVMLLLNFVERQVAPSIGLGSDTSRTYTMPKHQSTGQTEKESDVLQEHCPNSLSAPQFVNDPESSKHSTSSRTVQSETKQSCSLGKPYMENQKCASQDDPTTYLFLQQDMLQSEDRCSETQSVSCPEMRDSSEQQSHESVLTHLAFGDRSLPQPVHCLPRSAVEGSSYALRRYDLIIVVESVKFIGIFHEEKVYFKFYQPNAEVVSSRHTEVHVHDAGEEMDVQDVWCRLGILSTQSQIGHLLLASPPRISVCSQTSSDETHVLASCSLDSPPLLSSNKRECCYSKILRNISTGQQVAVVKISLLLEDVGELIITGDHIGRTLAEHNLGEYTACGDAAAAYKVVEELEEWKAKQQAIFRAEMCEKEKEQLALFVEEWNKKKAKVDAALKEEREKFAKMVEELGRAEDLWIQREQISEKEGGEQGLKQKMEAEWTRKLQELEELGAKMEQDIAEKEAQWRAERMELEQDRTALQQEVLLCKEMLKMKEVELEEVNKSRLTKEQVTYLLKELKLNEEKLQATLKIKSFYKEQWSRAVKEILHVKSQNRDVFHIKITKNERSQLKKLEGAKSLQETETARKGNQTFLKDVGAKINLWLNLYNNHELIDPVTRCCQSESCIVSQTQKSDNYKPTSDKNIQLKKELDVKLCALTAERGTPCCVQGTSTLTTQSSRN